MIIGIVRNINYDVLKPILKLYIRAGLTHLEVTMNSPNAHLIIKNIIRDYGDSLCVGAGTVCSMNDLKVALGACAQFIVTPIIDPDIIKTCVNLNIPVYPGAFTPTEIHKAWSMGATMIKIFPASSLGPNFIKDVKAALNTIKLLPTGGITLQNIDLFIKSGADGFGIGSPLFDAKYIESQNWISLERHFEAFANKQSLIQ